MTDHLKRSALLLYGFLATALAFGGLPLYIHVPDLYARHFGLSLTLMGFILLIVRIFDAVQDPVIGYLSDRYQHRRKAIIAGASIFMAVGCVLLYVPIKGFPALSFGLGLMIGTTALSVLTINYNAQGSIWQAGTQDTSRITSWREAFGLLGLLCAVILPPVLQNMTSVPVSFQIYMGLFLVLLTVGTLLFFRWQNTTALTGTPLAAHIKPVEIMKPSFYFEGKRGRFYLIYTLSMLSSSLPAVLVLFYIRHILQAESKAGLFLLLYFAAAIAGMPLWQRWARSMDRLRLWGYAMLLAAIGLFPAFFMTPDSALFYGVVCLVSGFALGAELSLPPACLSAMIQDQKTEKYTTTYFAMMHFLMKMAFALAGFIGLGLLDLSGFEPMSTVQTQSASLILAGCYALVPVVIKIIAAFIAFSTTRSPSKEDIYA